MPSSTPAWAGGMGPVSAPTPPHTQQNADQHPGQLKGSTPQGNDYGAPEAPMAAGAGEAGGIASLEALAL